MATSRLSPLQSRILHTLAGLRPRWTLSGGGALAGFHTAHRDTRDLDLFWQRARQLDDLADEAREALEHAALEVTVLQTHPAFARFRVCDGDMVTIVDLVADPVPLAEEPEERDIGGERILVDTPHQILVNKLCALLGRSELRDLEDVVVLLEGGQDLARALSDAPMQDAGFSPLTLAWVLSRLPIAQLVQALGREPDAAALEHERDRLVEKLLAAAVTGDAR